MPMGGGGALRHATCDRRRKHKFHGGYFITGGQFITERKRVGSWWWWWPVVAAAASASINFTREVYHEEKTSVIPLLAAAAAAAATARHREICIPQAPVFNAPYSVGISHKCLIVGKLEWLGYHSLKKVWWYVKLFRYNSGAWQTDRRTDGRKNCCINIALWQTLINATLDYSLQVGYKTDVRVRLCVCVVSQLKL